MRYARHKSKKKFKVKISLKNLPSFIFKEGDNFVAIMPTLDLTTCGETMEETQRMACEAAAIFIEECIKMGTLEEVLGSLGWHKEELNGQWIPPAFVAHHAMSLNPSGHIN